MLLYYFPKAALLTNFMGMVTNTLDYTMKALLKQV